MQGFFRNELYKFLSDDIPFVTLYQVSTPKKPLIGPLPVGPLRATFQLSEQHLYLEWLLTDQSWYLLSGEGIALIETEKAGGRSVRPLVTPRPQSSSGE